MSSRTIEIVVDVTDKTGGKVKGLQNQFKELDRTAQRITNRFKSFSTMQYAATIRLIDRVTEPGNRINNLLRRLAGAAWRISLNVADGALGKIRQVETLLMRIAGKAWTIGINVRDNVKGKLGGLLSGAAMGAGVMAPMAGMMGVGFGVANAVQAYAGFEQQMSKVQAITQLKKDSDEMKALVQQAKDLGASTAWTRQQVGEAQYYQALAGWTPGQIQAATPHLLNLASAGGTDLGRTSDIVTDAMTAFGLKAEETYLNKQGKEVNAVEHFADMLAKLQASSNTDISQAGEAFKYSANVIGAMFSGQSIQNRMQATEDAMIMTGLMANAGIKGSMAGTATRAVFSRMSSMNRNSYNALRAMGVEYKDEGGNILMPGEIMRNLSKRFKEGIDPNQLLNFAEEIAGEKIHADTRRKLDSLIEQTTKNGGKMGSADMAKMASMLAGQEAMSGLLAVLMGDWDAMAEKMDNVNGTAKEMADTMLDNLAGSFTILGSAWDAFQQSFLEGQAGEGLRAFIDTLTAVISRATKLFGDGMQIEDFGKLIGDVIGRLKNKFLELDGVGSVLAGGALAAGLMKIITLSRRAFDGLRNLGKAGVAGATTGGLSAAQKVGTMHVSAGVVNVNGKVSGAGGVGGRKVGNTAIIDNYNATKERLRGGGVPPTAVPSRFAGFGSAAAGGAAFAGIFGLLDIMSLKASNTERLAAASTEAERVQIARENRQAEWEAGAGVTGSVIGAAIGAGLGSLAGPIGTVIGGVVGGMIGEFAGHQLGEVGAANETPKGEADYFDIKPKGTVTGAVLSAYGLDGSLEKNITARKRGITKAWGENLAAVEQQTRFEKIDAKLGAFSPFQHDAALNATQDYYAGQRERMMTNPSDFYGTKDLWGGGRAEAAELNADQMVQMQAMERGEVVSTPTVALGEVQTEGFAESLYSQLESVAETAGEFISSLGSSITDGLASAMEGAGEIFSGLSDSISAGLEAASSMATSALESIQSAFSSAKDTIQSAWGELPGFFEGVFSGLGGAAAAAGSAIYSGLTAVIGSIIGAWEGAASTISGIISSIGSAASSAYGSASAAISGVIAGVRGHAEGGFITSPELSWVGERGAELILPLTDRERSLELLNQASGVLGLDSGLDASSFVSQSNGGSSSGEGLSVGGVTVNATFEISGADNPQDVMQTIQDNLESLADKVAAKFAVNINDSYRNQALMT